MPRRPIACRTTNCFVSDAGALPVFASSSSAAPIAAKTSFANWQGCSSAILPTWSALSSPSSIASAVADRNPGEEQLELADAPVKLDGAIHHAVSRVLLHVQCMLRSSFLHFLTLITRRIIKVRKVLLSSLVKSLPCLPRLNCAFSKMRFSRWRRAPAGRGRRRSTCRTGGPRRAAAR